MWAVRESVSSTVKWLVLNNCYYFEGINYKYVNLNAKITNQSAQMMSSFPARLCSFYVRRLKIWALKIGTKQGKSHLVCGEIMICVLIIEQEQGFKKEKPPAGLLPSACQSFSLISENFVSTITWRAHTSKALIKSQTQMLIIQQKYKLPSPPSAPQSNPWKRTQTQ